MIAEYFSDVERVLQSFPNIHSYALRSKVYNAYQGYIGGSITFESGQRLEFVEVKNTQAQNKLKYRYQYMDNAQALVFRYDNAPHQREVRTFPHHKHTPHGIQESDEPTLYDVLLEIAAHERQER